jgi:hypothetical protein
MISETTSPLLYGHKVCVLIPSETSADGGIFCSETEACSNINDVKVRPDGGDNKDDDRTTEDSELSRIRQL